ncbi:MAG: hypothetical protein QOG04_2440 [Actinomycetota bacterium]|jgi:hypothetical protein|nr:hypothetical protein [Actinomycetota bacterium]
MAAVRAVPGLQSIVDEVAAALGRQGVVEGSAGASKGIVRIERETNVKRVIRAYWTGFEVNVPTECIGLYLEVAEPTVHWTECYLSNEYRNWVLCFHEREDGDVQLSHYRDYATPSEAIGGFVDLSSWYTLTATDLTWSDVAYQVGAGIEWSEHTQTFVTATGGAIQESLKKSTIMWLRWGPGQAEQMPVWFLYDQKTGTIHVLSGERQQTIPGAATLREATVVLRWKGKNSQVAEIPADVRVLEKLTPEWDEVAERIAEKRLNIPGLPEDTAKRWRDECEILELKLRA